MRIFTRVRAALALRPRRAEVARDEVVGRALETLDLALRGASVRRDGDDAVPAAPNDHAPRVGLGLGADGLVVGGLARLFVAVFVETRAPRRPVATAPPAVAYKAAWPETSIGSLSSSTSGTTDDDDCDLSRVHQGALVLLLSPPLASASPCQVSSSLSETFERPLRSVSRQASVIGRIRPYSPTEDA